MTGSSDNGVSRRGVFGAGAAMAAGGVAGLAVSPAEAAAPSSLDGPPSPQASPIASTIASPRRDFLVYRTVGEFDFSVESASARRTFGGSGVYPLDAATSMWASIDVPGGVTLDDIEFYVYNNTGSTAYAAVWLWTANSGYFSSQLANVAIASTNSVTATRASFASSVNGPYPTGTKIFVTIYAPTNGRFQINGARLGMRGGGNVSVRTPPARAFDSRNVAKFTAGQISVITISEDIAPQGTVGLLTNIVVLDGSSSGYVSVYPANTSAPGRATSKTRLRSRTGPRAAASSAFRASGARRRSRPSSSCSRR